MPQSLAQVWLHIVFSTKDRRAFLRDEAIREEMFRMLSFHIKGHGCVSASVGGHEDHVHLLVGLSRTVTIAKLVEQLKTETSKWAKRQKGLAGFSWQAGYGAFSVSHSNLDAVDEYIRTQEKHHERMTFQDEFRRICEKHQVGLDERYAWE